MFCILWGSGSNWTENIAETTEAWELVEHAAQFHGAPICETWALFKICLFLCCPSLRWELKERNKHNETLIFISLIQKDKLPF